jgi:hypothetical protein
MKFKTNGYWQPTPKKMKQLGDALLAVSMYAQTQQMFTGESTALMIIGIVGLVGKFLTNFCTED